MPAGLKTAWQTDLGGRLSGVTAAEGRLFVASVDSHTLHALDASSGRVLWSDTVGGRVDSPPTVQEGRVVFGAADGWVYCLSASDGSRIWRFRAAPTDSRMVADHQIESVWPVHGSVLVQGQDVIAVAGRSSYLDGGLYAYRLDLKTGRVIDQQRISHERLTATEVLSSEAARYDQYYSEGTVSDVLAGHDNSVFLKATPVFGDSLRGGVLLTAQSGFLDNSLFERSFWYLVRPGQQPIGAQLIVHDGNTAFGFRAYPSAQRGGPWLVLGSGYTLFAAACPVKAPPREKAELRGSYVPAFDSKLSRSFLWKQKLPVRARAMVLAENVLLVAGSPDIVRPGSDPYAAAEGRLGGKLLSISRKDGKTLAEYPLEASPVWDGLAVTKDSVYLATQDGTVTCMRQLGRN